MKNLVGILMLLALLAAACGGDDDDATSAGGASDSPAAESESEPEAAPEPEPEAATEPEAEPEPATSGGGGDRSATVTLANGESFEFSILCALEPQEAAGSEILFSVVSYDDPYNLDVTQFGADSFGGAANISLYDSTTYDTVWDASSIYGTEITLELDGSTVRGQGTFLAAGEPGGEAVEGELVANC